MLKKRVISAILGILAVLAGLVAMQYTVMGIEIVLSPDVRMSHIDKVLSALIPGMLTIGALYLGFRFLRFAFSENAK
jgi:hypothetical protein